MAVLGRYRFYKTQSIYTRLAAVASAAALQLIDNFRRAAVKNNLFVYMILRLYISALFHYLIEMNYHPLWLHHKIKQFQYRLEVKFRKQYMCMICSLHNVN